MEAILYAFNINNTLFSLWGYDMSYLEFFGTVLNLISVYLVTRNNIWTWPIGNIAVILFAILFFQIQLYSDLFEQIYFLITGFYGWWVWVSLKKQAAAQLSDRSIRLNSQFSNGIYLAIIIVGTIALGYFTSHIHEYFPTVFIMPASYPYLDAFTTVMSFAATILMVHKKIECWYLWVTVDVIGIWLYFAKGVVFVSFLYLVFLIMASYGLYNWRSLMRKYV